MAFKSEITYVDRHCTFDSTDLKDSATIIWNGERIFLSAVQRLPYGKMADKIAAAISVPKRP